VAKAAYQKKRKMRLFAADPRIAYRRGVCEKSANLRTSRRPRPSEDLEGTGGLGEIKRHLAVNYAKLGYALL
jgi:hypothetical protein